MYEQSNLAMIRMNRKEVAVLQGNEMQILWFDSMHRILEVEWKFLT